MKRISMLLIAALTACDRTADAPIGDLSSLTSPAAPASAEPNLAADAEGIYLTWIEKQPDTTHVLRMATLQDSAFGAAHTIASGRNWFVNWADFPMLTRLQDGTLAAHWLERNGPGKYAYGVRLALSHDHGATWSKPIVPHRDSSESEHGFVSLFDHAQQLGAIWLDGRDYALRKAAGQEGGEMQLRFTNASGTGVLADEHIIDPRTCDCCQTSAALTTNGPIVAYRDRSPEEIRDIYVARWLNDKWTEGKPVHADNWKVNFCPVNGPAVAADGDNVAIAWFTAADSIPQVKLAFSSDAGATFGAPVRIDLGRPLGRVDIALIKPGEALVSWLENSNVYVRRVKGTKLSEPALVTSTSNERSSGFPQMIVQGKRVVFAWTEAGTPSQVRVSTASLQ